MEQKQIIEVIAKSLSIPSSGIGATTSLLNEIGVDSIEMVKLRRDLIKTFECTLEVSEIKEADTIEKLLCRIRENKMAS
jgi:acyl carrier protein